MSDFGKTRLEVRFYNPQAALLVLALEEKTSMFAFGSFVANMVRFTTEAPRLLNSRVAGCDQSWLVRIGCQALIRGERESERRRQREKGELRNLTKPA